MKIWLIHGEYPQLEVDVDYDENDEKMLQDFFEEFSEMYTKAGFTNIKTTDNQRKPGKRHS